MVCWAKRSLTRSVCRFGALPVVLAGRSRGMEPAGPTRRRSACSCSIQGLCTPPPRLPLFAFSGATSAGSRSSGLRQQGRAGQLQGRSRERPQVLDVQAKLCRGSGWALESRLMLSPLPMVVTAQKPSDVVPCWGLRFWAVAKACRNHTPDTRHQVKKKAILPDIMPRNKAF